MKFQLAPLDGGPPLVVTDSLQVIGRSEIADLPLQNDSVSRAHCVVTTQAGKLLVRDLGSRNGTLLNGKRFFGGECKPNDVLTVGAVSFRVIAPTNGSAPAKGKPATYVLAPAPNAADLTGVWKPGIEVFRGYRLADKIGMGGFAEVWKAISDSGPPVAVKRIMITDKAPGEARTLKHLKGIRHPHLIRVLNAQRTGNVLVMALELGDQTLLDRFGECHRAGLPGIPVDELLRWLRQVAGAIDYLYYSRKILHRDVKPANVLLVKGSAKLADFGLAKVLSGAVVAHSGIASFEYAPPEFFEQRVSANSDQFSLTAMYCYLRTGDLPYGGNLRQIAMQHAVGKANLVKIPESERRVIQRGLAKDPTDRYPSCSHMVMALKRAVRKEARLSGKPK